MDYGQFSLTGVPDEEQDPWDVESKALKIALSGEGIGKVSNTVVVLSPHQNNFAMNVTFELWSSEPIDDLAEWEEAFEVSLKVGDEGLTYGSPTLDGESIALAGGQYNLRICGQGFVARGWPGGTEPGDRWRWQVWPSESEVITRRLRSWAGERRT